MNKTVGRSKLKKKKKCSKELLFFCTPKYAFRIPENNNNNLNASANFRFEYREEERPLLLLFLFLSFRERKMSSSSSSLKDDDFENSKSSNRWQRFWGSSSASLSSSSKVNPRVMCRDSLNEVLEKTKHLRALMRLCLHEEKKEEEKKSTPNSKTKSLLERMLLFALLELSTRKASTETFKQSSQAWTSVSCAF